MCSDLTVCEGDLTVCEGDLNDKVFRCEYGVLDLEIPAVFFPCLCRSRYVNKVYIHENGFRNRVLTKQNFFWG